MTLRKTATASIRSERKNVPVFSIANGDADSFRYPAAGSVLCR
jgi:hypothetical protein